MRNRLQLLIAVLLAAAMLLQCFAAGAVLLDDPEPSEPPAETIEPSETELPDVTPDPVQETDAPGEDPGSQLLPGGACAPLR